MGLSFSSPERENNWGQIHINLVNPRGKSLRGAERFLVLQYEEAPLRLLPLGLTKLMWI